MGEGAPGMPSLRSKLRDPGVRPEFLTLYDYYETLRDGRPMPSRRDIDPTALPQLLGYLSLIDVQEAPRAFRYRLCGHYQVALIGQELTNKTIDAIEVAEVREHVRRHLEAGVRTRQPQFYEEALASMAGAPVYQRLLLPLSTDGDRVDTILLSTMAADPAIQRAEDWIKPTAGTGRT